MKISFKLLNLINCLFLILWVGQGKAIKFQAGIPKYIADGDSDSAFKNTQKMLQIKARYYIIIKKGSSNKLAW